MAGRECYHCKQWVNEGEAHDCWTTTEGALTRDLSDDLRDAWERLRETAVEFGEQRIYASHRSIMFSRRACYCFVRPRRSVLELVVFLGRRLEAPQVRRVDQVSSAKFAHLIPLRHRDQVEPPVTDWMREAYELAAAPRGKAPGGATPRPAHGKAPTAAARPRAARSSPAPRAPRRSSRRS